MIMRREWAMPNGRTFTIPPIRSFVEDEVLAVQEGGTMTLESYWCPTRANALRPLYQLIALAQIRPDGVWDGD